MVQDQLSELTGLALESLNNLGKVLLADREKTPPLIAYYAERWLQMYEGYLANPGNHRFVFNAQAVVIIVSESPIDGGLAASSMELMTRTQGLGMFYSGFFVGLRPTAKK